MLAAAVPYLYVPPIPLGPVKLQPFGILVAIGVLLGAHLARRHAERTGADLDVLQGMIAWMVIVGFIGSHIFDVLTYQPEAILEDPLILIKVWAGISSVGGLIGGFIGLYIFWRRSGAQAQGLSKLRYIDTTIFGVMTGYVFGRLGCAVEHDHPGSPSDFFLAVTFPTTQPDALGFYTEGIARHDLGFYEFLALCVIFGIVLLASRKDRPVGFLTGLAATLYGPVRFGLDFLRVEKGAGADPRYFGLTPAHYVSIGIFAIGVYLIWYAYRRRDDITPSWFGEQARQRQAEVQQQAAEPPPPPQKQQQAKKKRKRS